MTNGVKKWRQESVPTSAAEAPGGPVKARGAERRPRASDSVWLECGQDVSFLTSSSSFSLFTVQQITTNLVFKQQ